MDITKPLLRKKKLKFGLPELVWVGFSYESLLDFYYLCRMIGHGQRDHSKWPQHREEFGENKLSYGSWLKAGPQKFRGSNHKPIKEHHQPVAQCPRYDDQNQTLITEGERFAPKACL